MSSTATSINTVAVALGAVIGAVLRWRMSVWLNPIATNLPLGTLAVNCVGGLLAGACFVWFTRAPSDALRLFLVTGFLGGLTTFSTFSAESLWLVERGRLDLAVAHTLAHVLGALGCAALGARAMRGLLGLLGYGPCRAASAPPCCCGAQQARHLRDASHSTRAVDGGQLPGSRQSPPRRADNE